MTNIDEIDLFECLDAASGQRAAEQFELLRASTLINGAMNEVLDAVRPVAPPLKATPAKKLLCAVGDWPGSAGGSPRSERALALLANDYKFFGHSYAGRTWTMLTLRDSDNQVVEIQSLIAYPDKRGNGTTTMQRLCRLADELDVTLWLDALPYGKNRERISLAKLKSFYGGFGFVSVRRIDDRWISGVHRLRRRKFTNPMIRMPQILDAAMKEPGNSATPC